MRRVMTMIALALCLLGCDSAVLPWDRVELRTSETDSPIGCFLMGQFGELIVDPEFGTALYQASDDINPVVWPRGFTGRHVGSEVEVLDRDGKVVATTGKTYEIFYSTADSEAGSPPGEPLFACGDVRLVP